MKLHIPAAIATLALMTLAATAAPAKDRVYARRQHHAYMAGHTQDIHAIRAAITSRLNHDLYKVGDGNWGHIPFALSDLDIQGSWAHVEAQPLRYQNRLDRVLVLLHKEQGRWRVLQYGGGLSGKGVPSRLQKRWGLLP